jgi:hypothetical protein
LLRFTEHPPQRSPPDWSCPDLLTPILSALKHGSSLGRELDQLLVLVTLLNQLPTLSIQPIDFLTEFFGALTALDE